ncbi:Nucleoid-associated protein YgaU, contains BON and LysM domains [[Clostridium] polysaccharolyticum]|uniref:Nucleoid-associated protein YgaU, contains BON and LysM domains n=2 Tax=[Clostridium] polysaccharolyticum TaxID=29364 RepID=A0A1I0DCF1_9FIRM|nr:Nucleoid-associated protein YgaU, contains BON and LysM domains [[Clostridium] polysaccharolyticum]
MAGGIKMIESVYSSQTHGSTSSVLVKIPKNVRQVGQVNDAKKIYVEDYVMSFIKKLGMRKESSSELVVLLGQFVKINNCQCIFVSGAIELKGVIYEDNLVFTNEIWTNIYETIKQYFTNVEIVGWSIIRAGLPLNVDERVRKVHVDNFAGQDKTLLLYDSLEREEVFYVFEENKLKKQDGYYIYYDRNAEMQNYIITLREEHETAKPYSIPRRPKTVEAVESAKQPKKEVLTKKRSALVYGIGAMAAVVVLVFSASILSQNDMKLNQKAKTQDVLSENVKSGAEGKSVQSGGGSEEQGSLPVETAPGMLSVVTDSENDDTLTEKKVSKESPEKNKKQVTKKQESKPKKTKKEKAAKSASTTQKYYTVKKGDTLSSIAVKLYHAKSYTNKLKEINNLEDSDDIKAGQKLLLP